MGIPAKDEISSTERELPGHVDDQSDEQPSHPQAENYPPAAPSDSGGIVNSGTRGVPLHDQQNAQQYPPQQTHQPPQNAQTNNPLFQQNPQMNNPVYQQHPQQHPQQYPQHPYLQTPPPTSPYQQQQASYPPAGVPVQGQPVYPKPAPVPTPPNHYPNLAYRPNTQAWTTGLFDCMEDPNNAVVTFLAPCFTFGQIAEIIDEGQTTCTVSGILYASILYCTAMPFLISCGYRSKLRNKYNLVEVPAADWLTHVFCEWCALCQEYRELKNRGYDPDIGWQGNQLRLRAMQQHQQQQVQMHPPMNQNMNG
ncbi:hypothetical protein MKW94_001729 [Papaver nudicaule]|uniref:Uncharacterized protein n=1 Tax=Papaver nudicaule TaxID=74823 RepID=A0AA41VMU9_PAPNU|nr:hypothetical protein [Papaver nudicaule]MCL7044044.1 hypothetical protein [Papaver nudicaule]